MSTFAWLYSNHVNVWHVLRKLVILVHIRIIEVFNYGMCGDIRNIIHVRINYRTVKPNITQLKQLKQ